MVPNRGAEIWQQREWREQLRVWRGQRVRSAAESGKAVTKPPTTPEGKQKLVPRHDESSRMSAELIGKAEAPSKAPGATTKASYKNLQARRRYCPNLFHNGVSPTHLHTSGGRLLSQSCHCMTHAGTCFYPHTPCVHSDHHKGTSVAPTGLQQQSCSCNGPGACCCLD